MWNYWYWLVITRLCISSPSIYVFSDYSIWPNLQLAFFHQKDSVRFHIQICVSHHKKVIYTATTIFHMDNEILVPSSFALMITNRYTGPIYYKQKKRCNRLSLRVVDRECHKTYDISRTKFQNLNACRLVWQLALPNLMKPVVKARMKM